MQGVDVKMKQLMLIWSFKRKRYTDGSLSKHKARLCSHGGQQQWGVNSTRHMLQWLDGHQLEPC
eukprot:3035105-Ditylum_brightwellii.AAC.1